MRRSQRTEAAERSRQGIPDGHPVKCTTGAQEHYAHELPCRDRAPRIFPARPCRASVTWSAVDSAGGAHLVAYTSRLSSAAQPEHLRRHGAVCLGPRHAAHEAVLILAPALVAISTSYTQWGTGTQAGARSHIQEAGTYRHLLGPIIWPRSPQSSVAPRSPGMSTRLKRSTATAQTRRARQSVRRPCGHACRHPRSYRRPVVHRQSLLADALGYRVEPCPVAPRVDDSLPSAYSSSASAVLR